MKYVQPTADQINTHLATRLKRVIWYRRGGEHWRLFAARRGESGVLEVQIMNLGDDWSKVPPTDRIELL
jgi:hypothetical protein